MSETHGTMSRKRRSISVWRKKKKHYFYLVYEDLRIVANSMVHCKNRLIRKSKHTDYINEMITKIISFDTKDQNKV